MFDTGAFLKLPDDELSALYNTLQDYYGMYQAQQLSVKLSANSLYGASGNQYYRFCNYEVASDITGEGAHHMIAIDKALNRYIQTWADQKWLEKILQDAFPEHNIVLTNNPHDFIVKPKEGDVCNYGDTDSRYIEYAMIFKLANFKPRDNDEMIKFVEIMDEHVVAPLFDRVLKEEVTKKNGKCTMKMELEVMGGRGIFRAKKMYVMSVIWKDGRNIASKGSIKAVGVELKRKTSSAFIKRMQEKLIRALLSPNFPIEDIYKLTAKIVQNAKQMDVMQLCKITKLSDYYTYMIDDKERYILAKGARPAHKGSARWNHLLYKNNVLDRYEPLYDGKLKYYIAQDGFPIAFPVTLDELPSFCPPIDYAKQIELLLLRPLKSYLPEKVAVSNLGKSVIQNSF